MMEVTVHELDPADLESVAGGAGVRMDGNGQPSDRGFGIDPNG